MEPETEIGPESVKEGQETHESESAVAIHEEQKDGLAVEGAGSKDASSMQRHVEVFVGGLSREATAEEILKRFGGVGDVTEIRMRVDLEGLNKGYAFVRYKSAHSAKRATEELATGVVICGKAVSVLPAEDNDTLFLGNISKEWTNEQVLEKLAEYKVEGVVKLLLMEDKGAGKVNRGFGFLEFGSHAAAAKALKLLSGPGVKFGANLQAKVTWAAPLLQPAEEDMAKVKSVFIDGLPASWTQETVQEHFAVYGTIVSVVLSRNMPNAKRKGYGFINFTSREAAEKVITETNGKEIGSGDTAFTVSVKLANPPTENRGPRGGRGGGRFGSGGRGGRPPVPLDPEKAELLRMLRDQAKDWEKFNPEEVTVVKVAEMNLGVGENPGAAADAKTDAGVKPEVAGNAETVAKLDVAEIGADRKTEVATKPDPAETGIEGKRKAGMEAGGEPKRAKGGGEAEASLEVGPMGEWLAKTGAKGKSDGVTKTDVKLFGVDLLQTGVNGPKQEGVVKSGALMQAKGNLSKGGAEATGPKDVTKADVSVLETGAEPAQNAAATPVKSTGTSPASTNTAVASPKATDTTVVSPKATGTIVTSPEANGPNAKPSATKPSATASAAVGAEVVKTGPAVNGSAKTAGQGPVQEKAAPEDTTWDCPYCTVSNASEAELKAHNATRVHKIVERLKNGPKPVVKTPLSLLHEYSVKRKAELVFDTKADDKTGPFEVTVTLRGSRETGVVETVGTGIARDKKRAKQASAVAALLKVLERSPEVEAEFLKPPVDKNQGKSSLKSPSGPAGRQPNQAQGRRAEPPLAIAIQAINRGRGNGRGPCNGEDLGSFGMGGRGGFGPQRGGRISPGRGGRFGSGVPGGRGGFEIGEVNSVPLGGGRRETNSLAGVKRGYEERVNVDHRAPRQRTDGFATDRSGGAAFRRGPEPSGGNFGRPVSPNGPESFRGPLDNTDAMRAAALVAAFGFGTPAQTQAVSSNPNRFEQSSQGVTRDGLESGFARPTSLEGHVERALGGRNVAGQAGGIPWGTNAVRNNLGVADSASWQQTGPRNAVSSNPGGADSASWQQTAPTGGRSSSLLSRGSVYANDAAIPYDPSHPSLYGTAVHPPSQSHEYSTEYSHYASAAQTPPQAHSYAPVTQTPLESQRQTQRGQLYASASKPPPQSKPIQHPQKPQIHSGKPPQTYTAANQKVPQNELYPVALTNPPLKPTAVAPPSQGQYHSTVAYNPVEKHGYGTQTPATQNPAMQTPSQEQSPADFPWYPTGVDDWHSPANQKLPQPYTQQYSSTAQEYTSASQAPAQQYTSANPTPPQPYTSANPTPAQPYTSANPTPPQPYSSATQQYTSANQTPAQPYTSATQQYTSANQTPAQPYTSATQTLAQPYTSPMQQYTSANQTPAQPYTSANQPQPYADPTAAAQGADKLYGTGADYGQTAQQGYAVGYGSAPPEENFAQQIQSLAQWNSQQTSAYTIRSGAAYPGYDTSSGQQY